MRVNFSLCQIYPSRSNRCWIWHTTTGSSGRTFPWRRVKSRSFPCIVFYGVGSLSNMTTKKHQICVSKRCQHPFNWRRLIYESCQKIRSKAVRVSLVLPTSSRTLKAKASDTKELTPRRKSIRSLHQPGINLCHKTLMSQDSQRPRRE
jgi:hypothetical protein